MPLTDEQKSARAAKRAATLAAKREQDAASAAEQGAAPSAAVQSIAALAALEEIEKAPRLYVDASERTPTADGTLSVIQREQRVDGSLGEFLLCEVRKSKSKDQPDSVQRYSVERVQHLLDALGKVGVVVFD